MSQLCPVHPLIHVHVFGKVHSLLVPQDGLQYAANSKNDELAKVITIRILLLTETLWTRISWATL